MNVPELQERVAACAAQCGHGAEQLLEVLHLLRDEVGALNAEVVSCVAHELNLSIAEVSGVISFYDDFHTSACVDVCGAEACQAVGAGLLIEQLTERYGKNVREVFCLGNCAAGPSVRFGMNIIGRASLAQVGKLLDAETDVMGSS